MKKLLRVFHLKLWGPSVRDGVEWEIQHHLEERIEELMAQGMTRAQAEAQAMRALGDVGRLRRQLNSIDAGISRRLRLSVWLEALGQDVRYGLRAVRHNRGFATSVVLTLGLGLGATVALFAVVDALILRPLPYRAPHELAQVVTMDGKNNYAMPLDMKHALRLRESNSIFSSMFVHARASLLYTGGTEAMNVAAQAVSPEFEETLGVQPIIGRGLTAEDARLGARPVVTIDYGFWQTALGGAPDVLQRSIELDGVRHLVVGVMPRGFKFPDYATTVAWFPIPDNGEALGENLFMVGVLGRVRGSFEQANQRANALGRSLFTAEQPDSKSFYRLERFEGVRARAVHVRQSIRLLAGAVTLILLVAVVNVVNLLLIRLSARTRELSVRLALGAGRIRLARQLTTEFMTLALLAGALAVIVALITLRGMTAIMPSSIAFFAPFAIAIEHRALWFTFVSTVICGLLVSVGPAIAASRQARTSGDDMTRYAARTRGKLRVRSALVTSQVALSVILLVGAGLLLNSFVRLNRVDTGVQVDNLAMVTFNVSRKAHPDAAERGQYLRRIEERLEALPGVQSATLGEGLPGTAVPWTSQFAPQPEGEAALSVDPRSGMVLPYAYVRPDFFQVTGARLLAGRPFTEQDDRKTTVIIDEDLARALWPGRSAVGRRFRIREKEPMLTVVGVMADLKLMGQDDRYAQFEVLFPYGDYSQGGGGTSIGGGSTSGTSIGIRTVGDPAAVLSAVRKVIPEIDPQQPYGVHTARAAFANWIAVPRFLLVLVAALGTLALTLAAIGIYGVLSYGVSQRMHEFSVRVALGARAADLRGMIVKHGFGLAALGAFLGLGGALAATRFLRTQLYGVQPTDPLTLALVIALMLGVALMACLQPARRASRIDPAKTLRTE